MSTELQYYIKSQTSGFYIDSQGNPTESINFAVKLLSLEDTTTFIEEYVEAGTYSIHTCIVKS